MPNKYQVRQLPAGIRSQEEFKKSINQPLGQEWIPAVSHKEVTLPRIVTKPGLAIAPITLKKEAMAKYQEKAKKYVNKYHSLKPRWRSLFY